jgi:hypothetical protein
MGFAQDPAHPTGFVSRIVERGRGAFSDCLLRP